MKEVSCRVLDVVFRAARARGIPREALTRDVPHSVNVLRNKQERIDWSSYCRIMSNLSAVLTDDDLIALGGGFVHSPFVRPLAVIAGLLFTAKDLYEWSNASRGAGSQLFSCISGSQRDLGPNRLEVTLEIDDRYQRCREFFLITKGGFAEMPRIVGLRPAAVSMQETKRGAIYQVEYPTGGGALARVRRAITWPFTARAAAHELREAHEVLQQRYAELEDYRNNLEEKVTARTAELETANERLADTVARLEEAKTVRDRIFANINHEIRTPLSVISLSVARLRRHDAWDETAEQYADLDAISHNADRLLHLIDSLLLLAAGQEQKLVLRRGYYDIAVELRALVAFWRAPAGGDGLQIHYHGPDRCLAFYDEAALERVVTNLLSNAVKFTPRGGNIAVRLVPGAEQIEITVRDTGIGVDEALREHLFERFTQGRQPVRSGRSGSGIGLAIVKELVDAHGGAVSVESNRGGGTLFRVSLPLEDWPLAEGRDRQTAGSVVPPLGSHDGLLPLLEETREIIEPVDREPEATVLLAEDDPELRGSLAQVLGESFRVLLAADGLSALRLAKEYRPDLLISDVNMPGADGFELTRRFRELNGNRLAPVILLTAYGGLENKLTGLAAGAVDFLLKPVTAHELFARIRSQLAMRTWALRLHESEKHSALGVLSAGLAHEIRNPANTLANAIGPLRRKLPAELQRAGSPVAELLDVMQQCGEQIRCLARDLTGLVHAGEPDFSAQSIEEIVNRARAISGPILDAVEIEQDTSEAGVIWCAPPLVLQILANLLHNAADAAGPGGRIRIEAREAAGVVAITVTNTGESIPLDLRQRVFDPFFTTKPAGKGTGLGLTIARHNAERQGGTLDIVDSNDGVAFRLTLPRDPRAAPGQTDQPGELKGTGS